MRDLSKVRQAEATAEATVEVHEALDKYKLACTTCIVGIAVEESKTGGYDEDSQFDRFDLLDPDFPLNGADPHDSEDRPERVLMALCGGFTEDIVRVMGDMEHSWTVRCSKVKDADQQKASALWEFAKERASIYIDHMYGCKMCDDFESLGDELFT